VAAATTLRALLAANGDDPARFSLHSLRHGGATAYVTHGAGGSEVAALAGWSGAHMLSTYGKHVPSERRGDLQRSVFASQTTFAAAPARNRQRRGAPPA
jgi:integrase